jgi:hypothetical protein
LVAIGIAVILFLIIYLVWYLFIRKEYKDIPAQYRKKLETASKLAKNDMLGKLFMSGDQKHNRICYGKYFYLRFNLPKEYDVPMLDKQGKEIIDPRTMKTRLVKRTEWLPIDLFIVERKGFFSRLFNDPIFVLTYPEDHDFSSIFNDVVLKGFNIVPLDNYFYTLDRRNLDIDIIRATEMSYIKETVFEVMRDLDKLVQTTMNLDPKFQKDKEAQSMFELPQLQKLQGEQK